MPVLSEQQVHSYEEDGFFFARNLFSAEEIGLLRETAINDHAMDQAASSRDDGNGASVRLSLWNHPGDGIYGMFARCRRVVDAVEQLLHDEAYHYHSKMILKDAKVGGAWAWHQDYGYWYQNGLLFPNLCSVMIAVDKATVHNGCLQVLQGSHRMGRVNHVLSGEQAGADLERVEHAKNTFPMIHCEMTAGDAVFFHPNLLHASAANRSDNPRWALICCYNARGNKPYKQSHHPSYTKLHKVDNEMIIRVGKNDAERSRVDFANLDADDRSATSLSDHQEG